MDPTLARSLVCDLLNLTLMVDCSPSLPAHKPPLARWFKGRVVLRVRLNALSYFLHGVRESLPLECRVPPLLNLELLKVDSRRRFVPRVSGDCNFCRLRRNMRPRESKAVQSTFCSTYTHIWASYVSDLSLSHPLSPPPAIYQCLSP